jgi:hypothetical protein
MFASLRRDGAGGRGRRLVGRRRGRGLVALAAGAVEPALERPGVGGRGADALVSGPVGGAGPGRRRRRSGPPLPRRPRRRGGAGRRGAAAVVAVAVERSLLPGGVHVVGSHLLPPFLSLQSANKDGFSERFVQET